MTQKKQIKTSNDIVIRPRFQVELDVSNTQVLEAFENTSKSQSDFEVNRIDEHVFIKFPKAKQTLWTPQLHLEINELTENSSKLYGLFGPNPTLWLLFMFLHFLLVVIAIGFGIWLYSSSVVGNSIVLQTIILIMILCIWVALYIFGRSGRARAKPEMQQLKQFMNAVLDEM